MSITADYQGHKVHIYDVAGEGSSGAPAMIHYPTQPGEKLKCMRTGEFRAPKAGEWYLSGAIPEGYRAPHNLSTEFHIVTLVRVIPVTTYEIKSLTDAQRKIYTDQGDQNA